MDAISNKNDHEFYEVLGQLIRVNKTTGLSKTDDLCKSIVINPTSKALTFTYSILSNRTFHFTTGDTIFEVLADFMLQCDLSECKSFIESKILNALLLEMVAKKEVQTKKKET
jgi:hypothetical protein